MSTEDQLRAAGRAVREQVRDVPPLDLRAQPSAPRARASARARTFWAGAARRWLAGGGWLVPAAAAAAIVAVAATLVAVKSPPLAARQAGPDATQSASARPAAPADPEAVPRYYVAISGFEQLGKMPPAGQSGPATDPRPDSLVVGETLTGKRIATIAPPAGSTFAGVTGAADDRTFVLDSVAIKPGLLFANQRRSWYLLKVSPGTAPAATMARISFPLPGAADVNGIALSPDGARLAVLYQVAAAGAGDAFPYSGPFTLAVYSVATGTVLRSWTGTDPYHGSYGYGSNGLPDPNANLTWTSNGRQLAFAYSSSTGPADVLLREVDLTAPGGDLFRESSVIAKVAVSPTTGRSKIWCYSLGITGDGRNAICGAELPKSPPVGATLDALTKPGPRAGCAPSADATHPGIAEISLAGDRLARVLYEAKPACQAGSFASVLWSSPSGGTVLAAVGDTVVRYDHGKVTALDWPGAATTLEARTVAF
jgi:hypothetical protein